MRLTRITPTIVCSLALIVGCAKTEDEPQPARNAPSTQPAAVATSVATIAASTAPAEPTASMIMINGAAQWFPPARLRLSSGKDGKVVARLYSDDPKGVLTGKETVNSYDVMMVLPDISDPADISKTAWIDHSSSMDKRDSPYGIFLNNQQDILQPMDVKVYFQGQSPRMNVVVRGTFSLFHISEQTPNPAPAMVSVVAFLDAKVTEE
jgi:hypothetical protein